MRVISLKPLREFWERHPDAEQPLRLWFKVALKAEWRNLRDVRQTFAHADGVRTDQDEVLTVFNIAGNKYRLIARIRYDYKLVTVRAILTHAEYSRGGWKD
jgi:mRNA interferase HigB